MGEDVMTTWGRPLDRDVWVRDDGFELPVPLVAWERQIRGIDPAAMTPDSLLNELAARVAASGDPDKWRPIPDKAPRRYRPGPNANGATVEDASLGEQWLRWRRGPRTWEILLVDNPRTETLLAAGIIELEPEPVTPEEVVEWMRERRDGTTILPIHLDEREVGEAIARIIDRMPKRLADYVRDGR